jgi:EAL and modified HD-GYP domain-containing signal transduction protein
MQTQHSRKAQISRQAIYRHQLDLYGYELLFRSSREETGAVDGDSATAHVILHFSEQNLGQIAEEGLAFINLTGNFIREGHCRSLPKERVVLEVLEDVGADPAILGELGRLSAEGYRIALDDFVYERNLEPLIQTADIVKIDVLATRREAIRDLVDALGGFDVKLLAEKVETVEEYEFCRNLGFDYFQGFLFSRPEPVDAK